MAIALGAAWFDELATRPDILASLDFIELPGWALADPFERPHERVILHNLDLDWSLAAPDAIDDRWPERLHAALSTTGTPWFSLHLGFSAEQVRFDYHMHPASPPLGRELLLERVVAAITRARELCPAPLLIENLDYCPEGAYEHICDPAFISEVLERTGADLLFDLAHWQVSASWLGYDPLAALDRLPLDRAIELHISSPRPLDDGSGRLDDAHETLTGRDLELLGAVLERAAPRAITIEYRRDLDLLAAQIGHLRAILGESVEINGAPTRYA